MNRKALTELAIKNLKCPVDLLHLEVFDTEVIGLYIDVFPSGKKSYRLRYRNNKVLKVTTLGDAELAP